MAKPISKAEIQPGDIIFSVGTIDPGISKKELIDGFHEYSSDSYHRLVPLLDPVKTAQKVAGLGGSGHEDSVHAGVCIGYDTDGKTPIITDLHGHVQDMPIDKYYKPCSLRIYRPNIPPEAFVAAREKLEPSFRT